MTTTETTTAGGLPDEIFEKAPPFYPWIVENIRVQLSEDTTRVEIWMGFPQQLVVSMAVTHIQRNPANLGVLFQGMVQAIQQRIEKGEYFTSGTAPAWWCSRCDADHALSAPCPEMGTEMSGAIRQLELPIAKLPQG